MLFETVKGRRRLFRDGDPHDPQRSGKIVPAADGLPAAFRPLLA